MHPWQTVHNRVSHKYSVRLIAILVVKYQKLLVLNLPTIVSSHHSRCKHQAEVNEWIISFISSKVCSKIQHLAGCQVSS